MIAKAGQRCPAFFMYKNVAHPVIAMRPFPTFYINLSKEALQALGFDAIKLELDLLQATKPNYVICEKEPNCYCPSWP